MLTKKILFSAVIMLSALSLTLVSNTSFALSAEEQKGLD
ncbi:MAG TPA: outer membrane lipoprotein-sorting protein, partial [Colwellia sp.]|nr:outer membrane lipoprotein-sorting protein [Colwellia sp.]